MITQRASLRAHSTWGRLEYMTCTYDSNSFFLNIPKDMNNCRMWRSWRRFHRSSTDLVYRGSYLQNILLHSDRKKLKVPTSIRCKLFRIILRERKTQIMLNIMQLTFSCHYNECISDSELNVKSRGKQYVRFEQFLPEQPAGQVQLQVKAFVEQVPPFWHGFGKHLSVSTNVVPSTLIQVQGRENE